MRAAHMYSEQARRGARVTRPATVEYGGERSVSPNSLTEDRGGVWAVHTTRGMPPAIIRSSTYSALQWFTTQIKRKKRPIKKKAVEPPELDLRKPFARSSLVQPRATDPTATTSTAAATQPRVAFAEEIGIGRVTSLTRRPTSAFQPSVDDLSLVAAANRRPISATRYR